MTDLHVPAYGSRGPHLVLLHGGPGAAGHMAPVAMELQDAFRVLEPWQRGSGQEALTVARHVEDLREIVRTQCNDGRPAILGSSWGAMLALAYAAAHPEHAGPLVLVGGGTFDTTARARMSETIEERMTDDLRERLDGIDEEFPDPDERTGKVGSLIGVLFNVDTVEEKPYKEAFDAKAHQETWEDMLRCQAEGLYPQAFEVIDSPVLMLHGTFDPHPGRMIRDGLLPFIPHLEYVEWEDCGHYPWRERAVRDDFYRVLRDWLSKQCKQAR